MSEYRNLLLIASPGMEKTPALTRARELALKTGASLHLCMVDHNQAIANLRYIDESVMRMAADNYMAIRLRWLEGEVAALGKEGIKAGCSAIWGKPADKIVIGTILERKPDLVIKDVRATKPLLPNLFTPLDWELLRLCPAPLMLVNPDSSPQPKRIIATVDPMEDEDNPHDLNDQILRTAQATAKQCDAQLHAVYAYPILEIPPDPVSGTEPTHHTKVHQAAHAAHRKAFDRLMDQYSIPKDQRHFLEGKEIEDAILEFANHSDTDLIVLGTVYRSAMDRLMLGSTAERLLYRIHCDLMALKPDGFPDNLRKGFKTETVAAFTYRPKA